jgi:DNA-binding NarL/FixJ family response regulator
MKAEPVNVCVLGPRLLAGAVEALLFSIPHFQPSALAAARVALLLDESRLEPLTAMSGGAPGLVLLGNGTAEQLHRATRAGIHAFIHSNDDITELCLALDAAAKAEDFCSRHLLPALLEALRQSGGGVGETSVKGRLSVREVEVARLAADGMSNAEIARKLCVSLATVKFHLGSVFRKLELNGRVQLHERISEYLAAT